MKPSDELKLKIESFDFVNILTTSANAYFL